ncbi:MAG: 2-oxoglutarate dehydrogenase complex dihydrolipoyllysine-residue succinyltransferase [Rhodobacteraceae bacterium]|nr:2-oxoglutarate dehydrogenase complex dihydrolipoyllysine-residue succinyltransferase [Paracoccaceae bacterium]MBL6639568.1 2-oxoglutarate dehydrogenase complex dihydrolipoyllysine-residue succinyltransferase [Paracoccaceae bacterium]MBL6788292.1 2-oxoglutarate dehydrogenase complex dihydrolipoyllysine-residue succinyltransferase [Paracoccaceae bacterium]MBL6859161.1 2-oxoglutarate dehydrogenase complex dihydrolipoyllysine-residue succinyltransferase [Paracoccaceae bacterium]
MTTEIRVPTLGESVTEATVATWFKKPGDAVALDEMLCELETDKVTVEVPSPAAGVLSDIVAAEGITVGVDALLANIASGAGNAEASDAAKTPAPKAPSNAAADSSDIEVAVPTLGESVTEATVASWFKAPGDSVKSDEILCELETDKVSVEVPSPSAGVLKKIIAAEGSTVDATAILAVIGKVEEEGNAPAAQPIPEAASSTAKASSVEDAPAAKKAMAEAGLKPGTVQGTGRDGRVMKEDVTRAVAAAAQAPITTVQTPAAPRAPVMASDAAREERVKMTRLRQTIARRLKDSQNSAAMLTTYNEVDMSAVMDLRSEYKDLFLKKHGVKLGFMSFFTKACCHALQEVPEVNAEIDGTDIVYKNFVHMGIAAGTPTGLVVPVIRDVDAMSFAAIEQAISEKGQRARDGKLSMEEMQGGTFTISNGGVYGSLMSSPILNPPQSGILGMHKIQDRPIAVNGQVVIRPMMYLALSYDHRIVDGKGAVTFLVRVKEALEDPRRLLMDL